MENILTVSVLVFQGEKVLFVKSSQGGRDRLSLPGGKLKNDENIEECGIREVIETVGAKIDLDKKLSGVITRRNRQGNLLVTFIFLAETSDEIHSDNAFFIPYKDIENYTEVSEFSKLIVQKLNASSLLGIDRSEIMDAEGRNYLMYF